MSNEEMMMHLLKIPLWNFATYNRFTDDDSGSLLQMGFRGPFFANPSSNTNVTLLNDKQNNIQNAFVLSRT